MLKKLRLKQLKELNSLRIKDQLLVFQPILSKSLTDER